MAPRCWFFRVLWLALVLAEEQVEACSGSTKRCRNLTISDPFWLRDNVSELAYGFSDFEVTCLNNTPVLQSSIPYGFGGFAVIGIDYEQRSLRVVDQAKQKLSNASDSCELPIWNTSAKLDVPFRIAPDNLNLILYNCMEKDGAAARARRQRELVSTGLRCRNHSEVFVRAVGRYNETGDYGGYAVQGCVAAVVPVLGSLWSGEVNASDYK